MIELVAISYPESSGSLASSWSPGDQPLDKDPEDSGYEIELVEESYLLLLLRISIAFQMSQYSRSLLTRTPKGNKKYFHFAG